MYPISVLHFFNIKHLLNRIKRTSNITKFFGSSRLGELWFIYYWNNFCSQLYFKFFVLYVIKGTDK
ncbi:hypothetical protein BpHYR1_051178 [Brachionus plicatilis]|uniref:Uncharacterized protein n=1 Tax=Brachionus plicatilis TaxID=10195 RepID=A0A3M7S1F8_BRAPC|nr:hypothetical protein BpHYR1_051178 [Brachionus plicatilis]